MAGLEIGGARARVHNSDAIALEDEGPRRRRLRRERMHDAWIAGARLKESGCFPSGNDNIDSAHKTGRPPPHQIASERESCLKSAPRSPFPK